MGAHGSDGDGAAAPAGVAHRAIRAMTALEMGLAGLATATIFVLVLVQSAQRYLPIDGWTWTGELARYCLVWLTFVAAGVLVTRDGHIALQIVDAIPSRTVVRAIHALALLVVAATGLGLAWECWTLIGDQANVTTPSLGISMSWVYVLPLLGFASTFVRALVAAYLVVRHGVEASVDHTAPTVVIDGEAGR